MEQKLSKVDSELYRRCDKVLYYVWDPIGVSDTPEARDEYSSYVPEAFSLIKSASDPTPIARALVAIETISMGLPGNKPHALDVAELLLRWRSWIEESVT